MDFKYCLLFSCLFVFGSADVYKNGYHIDVGILRAHKLRSQETLGSRVVGGSQVSSASVVPHQAGIVVRLKSGWTSVCGGSLISNSRVLTAAHCWWDGQSQAVDFTIVLGSITIFTGGTRIQTNQVTAHPRWNTNDYTNDIAVARITAVGFNNNIQVIPLPTMSQVNLDFVGLMGTISGFGKTSDAQTSVPQSTSLHQTVVPIITNSVCQNSFSVRIQGSHLCTGGAGRRGTCDGDSGGPLTVVVNNRRIQVGVVSFGPPTGCEVGEPSVYTRVTAYLNWISAQL